MRKEDGKVKRVLNSLGYVTRDLTADLTAAGAEDE